MNTIILHDSDIREPLFDYLEEKLGKIRILEEKQTGRARADVVMITEKYLFAHVADHVPIWWGILSAAPK